MANTAWAIEVRGNILTHEVKARKSDAYASLRKMGWENSKQMKEDGMKVVRVRLVKV